MRRIVLNSKHLLNRTDMAIYMNQLFRFDSPINGLDALKDILSEVTEETEMVLTKDTVTELCQSNYGFKVMLVLEKVCEENPNIKISFSTDD